MTQDETQAQEAERDFFDAPMYDEWHPSWLDTYIRRGYGLQFGAGVLACYAVIASLIQDRNATREGDWQVENPLTLNEIARQLGSNAGTTQTYIRTLAEASILYPFPLMADKVRRRSIVPSAYQYGVRYVFFHPDDWQPPTNFPKGFRASARSPIPKEVRAHIFARDNNRCLQCGATEDLTIDHILAVSLGGTDEITNLQTLCRSCNSRKRDALP